MLEPLTRGIRQSAEWALSFAHLQWNGVNASLRTVALPVETEFHEVGEGVSIRKGVQLAGDISLDDDVNIGRDSTVRGTVSIGRGTNLVKSNRIIGDVEVGQYCAIAPHAAIQGANHKMHHPGIQFRLYDEIVGESLGHEDEGTLTIGNDVWIGTQATILPGVTVGDGAIIGAGAVVTEDVEPYAIVGGVPARQLGYRFEEDVRNFLLETEWWSWNKRQIRANKEFFTTDLSQHDGNLADLIPSM